jgi:hypothetical protein
MFANVDTECPRCLTAQHALAEHRQPPAAVHREPAELGVVQGRADDPLPPDREAQVQRYAARQPALVGPRDLLMADRFDSTWGGRK